MRRMRLEVPETVQQVADAVLRQDAAFQAFRQQAGFVRGIVFLPFRAGIIVFQLLQSWQDAFIYARG